MKTVITPEEFVQNWNYQCEGADPEEVIPPEALEEIKQMIEISMCEQCDLEQAPKFRFVNGKAQIELIQD